MKIATPKARLLTIESELAVMVLQATGAEAPRKRGSTMRIGILGFGLIGAKLGTIFTRAGHEVVFSYSRSQKKLEERNP
jgi:phosphoglycerate dehydrogenase-like enzyme